MKISKVQSLVNEIKKEVKKVIIEQDYLIDYSIIALLCGGHVLVEGVPGLGKTLFVKALSEAMDLESKRIQFTPDMMPSDIIGTKIYNMQEREFELRKGPVFGNVILGDEINRTPPKTQAGLLEAMEEETVSIDGETLELPQPYIVIATQNPIEYEGTYSLPEALLDRFLFKINIHYPSKEAEISILQKLHQTHENKIDIKNQQVRKVCTKEDILACRRIISEVKIEESLLGYIIDIISATRNNPLIEVGSSPRGGITLLNAAKARAIFSGRDYVIPEDVKEVAIVSLNHRIILMPEVELDGMNTTKVLENILDTIKVPR